MIRIVVVDDQKLVREGVKILLDKTKEIEIVGDIAHGNEALETIERLKPDIVLLDINMPDIDGLTVASQIRSQFPQIKIIMLSSHEDEQYVQKATQLGAKGYLLKSASSQELEWSIKLVYRGYSAIKSELLEKQFSRQKELQPALVLHTDLATNKNSNNGAISLLSESEPENRHQLELLIAKKPVIKNPSFLKQQPANFLFHQVRLSNAKKTMKSFEFKLLVLIILFCLGLLVFVALS